MLIEDADMISYSANGGIQSAQKDLNSIPFIQQVLSCAPYGRLGFGVVAKENLPLESSVVVVDDSSNLGKDLDNSEDLSGFAADVSSLFMGADSADLDSLLREEGSEEKGIAPNPEGDDPMVESNSERQETLQRMIDRRCHPGGEGCDSCRGADTEFCRSVYATRIGTDGFGSTEPEESLF